MGIVFGTSAPSRADINLLRRPCPACGGSSSGEPKPDRTCPTCDGYGGDPEAEARYWETKHAEQVEVGDATGAIVLAWLGTSDPIGWMRAGLALSRLDAVRDPEALAVEPSASASGRLQDGGAPGWRLAEVHAAMVALAERAMASGVNLTWS